MNLIREIEQELETAFSPVESELSNNSAYKYYIENVYQLVRTLQSEKKLPALFLHFDRLNCEDLAKVLSQQLELEERAYKRKNGYPEKIAAIEAEIMQLLGFMKRNTNFKSGKIAVDSHEFDQLDRLQKLRAQRSLLTRVLPEFSFVDVSVDSEELSTLLKDDMPNILKNPLLRALRRGIGAHHAGLPKKYRQAVENLFRMKKLTAVFATGTLAMGINMPCKTCVFVGSSPYLNAMNFRQMQGRAGRRGFDEEGYVVFFGMTKLKVKSLLTSTLSDIIGNVPISPTMSLRIISKYLAWEFEDKKIDQKTLEIHKKKTIESAIRLLNFPFFGSATTKELAEQMKVYTRLSIEFLVAEGFLDSKGIPQQFCGLILHLFYLEPANFVFVALLRSGLFEKLVKKELDIKQMALKILPILCHLFCREKLYEYFDEDLKGPSKVILPPLPAEFANCISDYQNRVLKIFSRFMRFAAIAHEEEFGLESELPLSKQKIISTSNLREGSIGSLLTASAIEFKARSAFIATSGHGDRFEDLNDLVNSLRQGLYLDSSLLPVLDFDMNTPLNAYLYDLYNHKQKIALIEYNCMRHDVIFDNVKEFTSISRVITTALEKRATDDQSTKIASIFNEISTTFAEIFNDQFCE